jgi:hypothetical protein
MKTKSNLGLIFGTDSRVKIRKIKKNENPNPKPKLEPYFLICFLKKH